MGRSFFNPSIKSYDYIKNKGLKIIFMWPDTRDWACEDIVSLYDYSDLHVSLGGEKDEDDVLHDKHIWLWTPQNENLFYNDFKSTRISFIGSLNGYENERINTINYLRNNGIDVFCRGGQREHKLSPEEHARLIRTSLININFPQSVTRTAPVQLKGRVTETIASCSLLMDKSNVATRRRLVPGEDYIEYNDDYHLFNILKTIDDITVATIAMNGHRKYNLKYKSDIFWDTILKRIV
jgi:hypothetical protein